MHHSYTVHHDAHVRRRAQGRPEPVPRNRIPYIMIPEGPSLVRRSPVEATSTPRSTCGPNDDSPACEKPASSMATTTLPVVLGAVYVKIYTFTAAARTRTNWQFRIPIVCAVVVLLILHRRHIKRLQREDANDKHKSLDFGMDIVEPGAGGKKGETAQAEKSERKGGKGMSLDMAGSPYLLPPELHGSRESLRSLSRSISADDDKYRPATSLITNDNASMRSYRSHLSPADDMRQNLLQNAQTMSRSTPPLERSSLADSDLGVPVKPHAGNGLPAVLTPAVPPPPGVAGGQQQGSAVGSASMDGPEFRKSNDYLGTYTYSQNSSPDHHDQPKSTPANPPGDDVLPDQAVTSGDSVQSGPGSPTKDQAQSPSEPPPVLTAPASANASADQAPQLPRISLPVSDGASDYGDTQKSDPEVPAVNVLSADDDKDKAKQHDEKSASPAKPPPERRNDPGYGPNMRRLTMGLRPLPPEDPSDNPEQRANRIRSFYKEYFDENNKQGQEEYWEDFGPEVYGDAGVYDPSTGEYSAGPHRPFAEPVGRRAMTPPPRAPPRFQGAARHVPTNSAGGSEPPRAFSSASGRAQEPRKPAPPPAPLHVLPSPALLKDEETILHSIDYAPGKTIKDQREGRPDTPTGGLRPYSPAVPAHSPLVSSYDDLAVMPSPYVSHL